MSDDDDTDGRDSRDWKGDLLKRGLKLMSDPRVAKLVTDPRVGKAVVALMTAPGKVKEVAESSAEALRKRLHAADEEEVNDLKRTVRRLEEELSRLDRDRKR